MGAMASTTTYMNHASHLASPYSLQVWLANEPSCLFYLAHVCLILLTTTCYITPGLVGCRAGCQQEGQFAWWGASCELVGAAHVAAQPSHPQAPSQHSHTAKAQIFCCHSSAAQVVIFHDISMLAGAAVSGFILAEEHVLLQVGNGKGFCQQKIHLHSNVPANSY